MRETDGQSERVDGEERITSKRVPGLKQPLKEA